MRSIYEDKVSRYSLDPLPQAQGVILKALDGSTPRVVEVRPTTIAKTFNCVNVDAGVQPLGPTQSFGEYNGKTVLRYVMVYQEVGEVA